MAQFPASPIDPAEFFEDFVPARFAMLTLPAPLAQLALSLGVHLRGDGGGEWLYQLRDGALEVIAGSSHDAEFTLIQSVEDWRGTLWEGKGAVVVDHGRRLLGSARLDVAAGSTASRVDLEMLERLAGLDGVLRAVVTDGPGGDWGLALQFGPGKVPDEPCATVRISHADAHKMASGNLPPFQAFLGGRVNVSGDMLLVMQLQSLISELLGGR